MQEQGRRSSQTPDTWREEEIVDHAGPCSLFCEEQLPDADMLDTGTRSQPAPSLEKQRQHSIGGVGAATVDHIEGDGDDDAIRALLQSQPKFLTTDDYADRLRRMPGLAALRSKAVRWTIVACGQLKLSDETLFSAVNCLDRLVSRFLHKNWESWMMELSSIACLSLVAKFLEVEVPPIHAFPMEGMDHCYDLTTIKRMELLVLDALHWRLRCITAYSYVQHHFTSRSCTDDDDLFPAFVARATDLLITSLLDICFLSHHPINVAASVVRRAAMEFPFTRFAGVASSFYPLVPEEVKREMEGCFELMTSSAVVVMDPLITHAAKWSVWASLSSVTVIRRARRSMLSERCLRLDVFFDGDDDEDGNICSMRNRKRKWKWN